MIKSSTVLPGVDPSARSPGAGEPPAVSAFHGGPGASRPAGHRPGGRGARGGGRAHPRRRWRRRDKRTSPHGAWARGRRKFLPRRPIALRRRLSREAYPFPEPQDEEGVILLGRILTRYPGPGGTMVEEWASNLQVTVLAGQDEYTGATDERGYVYVANLPRLSQGRLYTVHASTVRCWALWSRWRLVSTT